MVSGAFESFMVFPPKQVFINNNENININLHLNSDVMDGKGDG